MRPDYETRAQNAGDWSGKRKKEIMSSKNGTWFDCLMMKRIFFEYVLILPHTLFFFSFFPCEEILISECPFMPLYGPLNLGKGDFLERDSGVREVK